MHLCTVAWLLLLSLNVAFGEQKQHRLAIVVYLRRRRDRIGLLQRKSCRPGRMPKHWRTWPGRAATYQNPHSPRKSQYLPCSRRRLRTNRPPFQGHAGTIFSAVFSPDGGRVLTASDDKTARLWEAESGKLLAAFQSSPERVSIWPSGVIRLPPSQMRKSAHQSGGGTPAGSWPLSKATPAGFSDRSAVDRANTVAENPRSLPRNSICF
jgi:hypothetical protein